MGLIKDIITFTAQTIHCHNLQKTSDKCMIINEQDFKNQNKLEQKNQLNLRASYGKIQSIETCQLFKFTLRNMDALFAVLLRSSVIALFEFQPKFKDIAAIRS